MKTTINNVAMHKELGIDATKLAALERELRELQPSAQKNHHRTVERCEKKLKDMKTKKDEAEARIAAAEEEIKQARQQSEQLTKEMQQVESELLDARKCVAKGSSSRAAGSVSTTRSAAGRTLPDRRRRPRWPPRAR